MITVAWLESDKTTERGYPYDSLFDYGFSLSIYYKSGAANKINVRSVICQNVILKKLATQKKSSTLPLWYLPIKQKQVILSSIE